MGDMGCPLREAVIVVVELDAVNIIAVVKFIVILYHFGVIDVYAPSQFELRYFTDNIAVIRVYVVVEIVVPHERMVVTAIPFPHKLMELLFVPYVDVARLTVLEIAA